MRSIYCKITVCTLSPLAFCRLLCVTATCTHIKFTVLDERIWDSLVWSRCVEWN